MLHGAGLPSSWGGEEDGSEASADLSVGVAVREEQLEVVRLRAVPEGLCHARRGCSTRGGEKLSSLTAVVVLDEADARRGGVCSLRAPQMLDFAKR